MQRDELAASFVALLKRELTPEEMREVATRNRAYGGDVCASHDFVDANVVMAQAFKETTGNDVNLESQSDLKLWSDAWSAAKKMMD